MTRYYKHCIMYLLTGDRTLVYVYMPAYKNYKYIDSVKWERYRSIYFRIKKSYEPRTVIKKIVNNLLLFDI